MLQPPFDVASNRIGFQLTVMLRQRRLTSWSIDCSHSFKNLIDLSRTEWKGKRVSLRYKEKRHNTEISEHCKPQNPWNSLEQFIPCNGNAMLK